MHDQSHLFTHHQVPIAPHAGVHVENKSSAERNQRAESREQRAAKQRAESKEEGAERGSPQITWCRIAGDLQVSSRNWTDCKNTISLPHASTRATTAAVNASWALDPGSMTGGQAHAMSTVNRYRHGRHAPACGLRVLLR